MTSRPTRSSRRVDPFKILGISPTASPAEITAAYRGLAKKFHPDRYGERPERIRRAAEQRMQEINEAYKLAREAPRRREDDSSRGPAGGTWNATGPGSWARTARRGGESAEAMAARLEASREQAERAAREHEAQARAFQRMRMDARKSARYGDAVARAKSRLAARVPSTLYGIGQAAHSNELPCRSCKTIQRLPEDWQERLSDTAYFCSSCDRVLLSR